MADKEYIEREAALEFLKKSLTFSTTELDEGDFRKGCIAAIKDDISNIKHMPSADVVEVVRCKNCSHCDYIYPEKRIGEEARLAYYCRLGHRTTKPNGFCDCGTKAKERES